MDTLWAQYHNTWFHKTPFESHSDGMHLGDGWYLLTPAHFRLFADDNDVESNDEVLAMILTAEEEALTEAVKEHTHSVVLPAQSVHTGSLLYAYLHQ
mgnify:CR=1 FL=1